MQVTKCHKISVVFLCIINESKNDMEKIIYNKIKQNLISYNKLTTPTY